jgi:Xaa-Pro aminopeptidase
MFRKSLYLRRLEHISTNEKVGRKKSLFRNNLNKVKMTVKYDKINTNLFTLNRNNLCKELKSNSLAIFYSNDEMPRNGDCFFPFRQNSDLFYLSGIDQEHTILIVFPDCPNPSYKEVLFVRKTNEHIKIWEGHKYTKREATETSGVKSVFWLENFDNIFKMLANWADNIYLNINENDRAQSDVNSRNLRFAKDIKNQLPAHNFERAAPILTRLREIKSEIEVDIVKHACSITEKALRRVLGFVKPDVWEFEIEAEITHEFIRNRANGHAYTPIVASGANACCLHYIDNNAQCKEGELILMDFGAEYANYASDLTRTIPVSGKFSPRQKEVYNAVLTVMKAATKLLVIDNVLDSYHREVGELMEEQLIKLGLLNAVDVKKQDPQQPLYKKYFMHGTSHFMGLDVHDVGNRHMAFKPGMIFTCEPGIYIQEENLGIRIENDYLITENGPVDLMASIPIEAEEIEALMNK